MQKLQMFAKQWKPLSVLINLMNTPYFGLFLFAVELLGFYLGLDLMVIIVISLCITINYLFQDNMNCMLVVFLHMCTMISIQNTPGDGGSTPGSGYYFNPAVYIPIIFAVGIPAVAITARAISNMIKKKIRFDGLFFSVLAMSVSCLTNGLFSTDYIMLNLMFGFFMFFFFFLLFNATLPWVHVDKESLKTISIQVLVFSLMVLVEFTIHYIQNMKDIVENSTRPSLFLGWGNRNTIGMLLVVSLPFIMGLVRLFKNTLLKITLSAYATLIIVAIVFTFSRQCYMACLVLVPSYFAARAIKSKDKERLRMIVVGATATTSLVTLLLVGKFTGFFDDMGMNLSSNGRMGLYKKALETYVMYPVFGGGFYFNSYDPVVQLSNVMPYACHDTLLEMMGACGTLGIVAYCVQRFFTVKTMLKNFSKYTLYPIIALSMFLLMSLVDIHIFDLLGSALYVLLLCLAMAKEKGASITDETPSKVD